jgi:CelD/BcsL family acetyltransferase involved in cellulose biosynthesis
MLVVRDSIGSPSVPLPAGADPEAVLNPGRRSDLRRARRRADRRGELTFDLVSPALTELPGLLEETWRVEAASWKGAAGTALSADSARGRFFVHYLTLAARTDSVRVALARLDGRAVASQLATVVDGRLWLFKIGFDQAVADCSPGHLLMLEVLRGAVAEGLSSVELMGRPEPWTQMWTQQVRPCISLRYYPPNLTSFPVLADDVRHRWRMRSG